MYNAVVTRIQTRPHPNADRLLLGLCQGYQVVVSTDTLDGTLGVFFPTDGQLSQEMAEANDLIRRTDPVTGEKSGGFFEENRRVRSQKFRGEKSDGFWMPLNALAWTKYDLSTLKEGDQFTELNGVAVCNKYYTPATLRAMKSGKVAKDNRFFAKHSDTAQLKHDVATIMPGSILYFTEKVHGTSGRYGYVWDEVTKNRHWFARFLGWFAPSIAKDKTTRVLSHVHGTRNVIINDRESVGYHGSDAFRWNAIAKLENNLHPGEVLYYELVGYDSNGGSIMGSHYPDTQLKDIKKQYGDTITYTYGQPEGTCGLYVYRITRVAEDGSALDLSWPQVKARCAELGIKHVPELHTIDGNSLIYDGATEALIEAAEAASQGPSVLDMSHIREGVAIRVESADGRTYFLKHKSFVFGVLEGYLKASDDYVDTEEIS
jgi:hypothetical protein